MKLTIARLGHRGDGIAEGVYAPGTLPGEEVEGELQGDTLTDIRILTPSSSRVKPPCSHARTCGGCLMQHASDATVAEWKTAIVRGALEGQGLSAEVRPIITSPPRSRRRATLAARRTKGGVLMGFHLRASDTIAPVPNCQLLHPDLIAAFPALEALVKIGGSRTVEMTLAVTRTLTGADVVVTNAKPADAELQLDLARLVEAHGLARLTWNGEVVAQRTPPIIKLGAARVALPPAAFLQATEEGEAALLTLVREAVGPAKKIIDLFSGLGTFSLPLAQNAEVHAVENDVALLTALDKGFRLAEGLKRVTTDIRDLYRRPLEPDEFKGIDAVVIDPPRAGAEAQCHTLAKSKVPVIAMVSCNPVTFARDAKILVQGGYKLHWVQPVDQFRWSNHVELAALFTL
ncbi:class I SAM-dependent RNA methyltransferase [Stagnihabitans tardus]|uniref:Class I SAM-dependent RNA methyltransferase n=1 Tax=Stagnihabitans tardus TaxID=2699202 RepID=A0AAE4Y7X7_9RHOB|nr:class I SAM-dependent RNA methyltransferase [Stagnihabitans tardus]